MFTKEITDWYLKNRRELPWRGETDPYRIWISEIILQQTRINQGWNYYLRFIERFPDVRTLAQVQEDEVLKYWQGLGYYSRARNLHQGARQIMERHGGVFPHAYDDILRIKGVGEYTAAAIASLAFGLPYPAIDGNVSRVLSRVFGVETPVDSTQGKKEIKLIANGLIDRSKPDIFNQALMDFGSLQCTPTSPKCDDCCLALICKAKEWRKQSVLPVKSAKIIIKKRFLYYFFIRNNGFTYLRKRTQKDVWQGLYEFPMFESDSQLTDNKILGSDFLSGILRNCQWTVEKISLSAGHQLTHQQIIYQFITININNGDPIFDDPVLKTPLQEVENYPVAKIMEKFWRGINFFY
ncbi:MAG: A/G-specific adenine glycosylase [Tannerella sp.]|nr:A/G-specific adenine glycosylase [Tannerella sp.]